MNNDAEGADRRPRPYRLAGARRSAGGGRVWALSAGRSGRYVHHHHLPTEKRRAGKYRQRGAHRSGLLGQVIPAVSFVAAMGAVHAARGGNPDGAIAAPVSRSRPMPTGWPPIATGQGRYAGHRLHRLTRTPRGRRTCKSPVIRGVIGPPGLPSLSEGQLINYELSRLPSTARDAESAVRRLHGRADRGRTASASPQLLALVSGARQDPVRAGRGAWAATSATIAISAPSVQPRIAYMPQGLGKNLHRRCRSVENVDFFGLFEPSSLAAERAAPVSLSRCWRPMPVALPRPPGGQSSARRHEAEARPLLRAFGPRPAGGSPTNRRLASIRCRAASSRAGSIACHARRPGTSVLVATAYMERG